MILPKEYRHSTLTMNVLHPVIHTLEGDQIDTLRQRADNCFALAEQKMIEIGHEGRANGARMWRLWLRLTDRRPEIKEVARHEVQEGLKDIRKAIDLLPFAQTFNIPFDPQTIKSFIEQQKKLGGLNEAETFAELQMAEQIMPEGEFASFLENNEMRFIGALSLPGLKAMLSGKRIESLVGDGQTTRARHLLEERKGDFVGSDYERLSALISAKDGNDPRANLEEIYRQSNNLMDLQNLIGCIGRSGDWRALKPLLEELFRRERTARNAHQLIDCMRHLPDADDNVIVQFIEENKDLLPTQYDLACEMAWALFRLGRWQESRKINDDLLKDRHNYVDIALDINLAILLGESERFAAIIDREWQRRSELNPELLMLLATIAAEVDQTAHRSFELAELAASKAPDDAKVLINSYMLAVQLGLEDEVKVGEWISRAIALSDQSGPLWKADMREVAEMIRAHRERSRRSEEAFLNGDIPVYWAVGALNVPLSRILLDLPRNNQLLDDYRRLALIPIISGARLPVELSSEWTIGLDVTTIMLLWQLDLLSLTMDAFPAVVIAPDMMPLLFNERRRVRFHQPSRVKCAEAYRNLNLQPITSQEQPPAWLIGEVGIGLAQLLQAAHATKGYVIHPSPIHTLSNYALKEANLREYESLVISTKAFSHMLFDGGYITGQQYERSLDYLNRHDQDHDKKGDSSGLQKPLYLDELALSYLQSAGILKASCTCGLNIKVNQAFLSEQEALIKAAFEGRDLTESLDEIRRSLQHAFETGKAVFLPRQPTNDDSEQHETPYHTAISEHFPRQVGPCSAICIDDRFFNKYPNISDQHAQSVPVICILDLLRNFEKHGLITQEERNDKLHRLRKSGFFFIPMEPEELEGLLRKADLDQNMQLKETAEMRVLRRSLMRIRSLDIIQQPFETPFLDRLRLCCVLVIMRLWRDQNLPNDLLIAVTDWLWRNILPSPLDWARTARGKEGMKPEMDAYAIHVEFLLRIIPSMQGERLDAFRKWAEQAVFEPLLSANSDLIGAITLRIRDLIEEMIKKLIEKNAESLAARYLCNLYPHPIRMRLLSDELFRQQFGLMTQHVMNVADFGPMDQRDFINTVRKAFLKGKELKFECLNGKTIFIEPGIDGVSLSKSRSGKSQRKVLLREPLLLSPDPETRNLVLNEMIVQMGPTASDFTTLKAASLQRELTDEEVSKLITENATGFTTFKINLERAFKDSGVTLDHIVPDYFDYYERFSGPDPGNVAAENYIRNLLPKYRKELLQRDLSQGLAICLLGTLRDDLSPAPWIEHIPVDDLWNALTFCEPLQDPISLLGALDIALYRMDDERFRLFAGDAVSKLIQDSFLRPDGIDAYILVPILAELTLNRINTIENGCLRMPYWKRMCSWMQALLILRMTLSYSFDIKTFSKWIQEQMTLTGYYAKLLDLRREPMYGAAEMTPVSFRSEIVGRLAILKSRHLAEGRIIPKADEIEAAVSRITANAYPWSCALPGPLEGHRRPVENNPPAIPTEIAGELVTKLRESDNEALLSSLARFSQRFVFDDDLLDNVGKAIEKLVLSGIPPNDYEKRIQRLADVGLIAASHRDQKLAMIIGNIVTDSAGEIRSPSHVTAIMNTLLVSGASFENETDWASWLEEQLKKVAENIPQGDMTKTFLQHLEELKKVFNLRLGIHTRAEALAKAAT